MVYSYFFAGLLLISVISFIDDLSSVPSKYRIVIHFAAMMLLYAEFGFFSIPWYFVLIALVVATGILNAYNFMDGINGITGGYSLVVIGSLWYINNYSVWFVDNNLIYCVAQNLTCAKTFPKLSRYC